MLGRLLIETIAFFVHVLSIANGTSGYNFGCTSLLIIDFGSVAGVAVSFIDFSFLFSFFKFFKTFLQMTSNEINSSLFYSTTYGNAHGYSDRAFCQKIAFHQTVKGNHQPSPELLRSISTAARGYGKTCLYPTHRTNKIDADVAKFKAKESGLTYSDRKTFFFNRSVPNQTKEQEYLLPVRYSTGDSPYESMYIHTLSQKDITRQKVMLATSKPPVEEHHVPLARSAATYLPDAQVLADPFDIRAKIRQLRPYPLFLGKTPPKLKTHPHDRFSSYESRNTLIEGFR